MSKFETAIGKAWEKLETELGRAPNTDESNQLEGELFELWRREQRFDDLIQHLQESLELEGELTDCMVLCQTLRGSKDIRRIEKLYRGLLNSRARAFWQHWPGAEHGHVGHMREAAKKMSAAMDVYAELFHNYWSLGDADGQARIRKEMQDFQTRQPPIRPEPDRRKIDETLFWELIADARADAGSAGEFAGNLEARLTRFPRAQLAKFAEYLAVAIDAVNTWDLWAFAYLARGGCSDDSFDYFRAWLVAQGNSVHAAASIGPNELLARFEPCWDLQCEELLSAASNACVAAGGKELPPRKTKPAPIRGERWNEQQLPVRYPQLWQYFS